MLDNQPELHPFARVALKLLKGNLHFNKDKEAWNELLKYRSGVEQYFLKIGIFVFINESEGYAYLTQKHPGHENLSDSLNELNLPCLTSQAELGKNITLLLALLREKLYDAEQKDKAPVVSQHDIFEMLTPYFPETHNEQKRFRVFKKLIKQAQDFAVLHEIKNQNEYYRIEPILKAKINVQDYENILAKMQAKK